MDNISVYLTLLTLLFTGYALYSLFEYSTCLEKGSIGEYEPKTKYNWFALLVCCGILQRQIIYVLHYFVNEVSMTELGFLNNGAVAIEMLLVTAGFHRHFGIKGATS